MRTKIAVVGYGALGSYVVRKAEDTPDIEVVGIVSRRADEMKGQMKCGETVYPASTELSDFSPDVAVVCTESEKLFELVPKALQTCHTVDSFDMHPRMLEYYEKINEIADVNGHIALYAMGWDPGLFSLARLVFQESLPFGKTTLEYGIDLPKGGVSRGHTAELNRVIDGIELACSRTLPRQDGKICRNVFVALKPGEDQMRVFDKIMDHPYFKDDRVTIYFTTPSRVREELGEEHSGRVQRWAPHPKSSIPDTAEFKLVLASNPEFTAQILLNGVRACEKMAGVFCPAAYNITQIPPFYLSSMSTKRIIGEII